MARTAKKDKVRELKRTLFRAAKADPNRRFHALHDKVCRRDVLEEAWGRVRRNRGAPGIDGESIDEVEQYGASRLLAEIESSLRDRSYRPSPARRAFIPKPGREERRALSIPTVKDRIVQAALKTVIEPIFEADMAECSYGFRPRRSTHDALQVLIDEAWQGRRWVVETDIADCFSAIPHDQLMQAISERIVDRGVLALCRSMLSAGVMQDGVFRRPVTGTPQGGVISPLLANLYLNRLDREWERDEPGTLVRYADDLVVMCESRESAEAALSRLRMILAEMGLYLNEQKTQIVHLNEGGQGLDFLGFHHRWVRAKRARHVCFLARWPSRKALAHARNRVREITARRRLLLPVEEIVQELNEFLRGWAGYFRFGNSARHFDTISFYAQLRLAGFVAKRHGRGRGYGRSVLYFQAEDRVGLIDLNGIVVAPRPHRDWRG